MLVGKSGVVVVVVFVVVVVVLVGVVVVVVFPPGGSTPPIVIVTFAVLLTLASVTPIAKMFNVMLPVGAVEATVTCIDEFACVNA